MSGDVPLGVGAAYVRKTKTLEAALPWLYLKGVSSGEMGAALEVLVGPQAKGLSASTVSRLNRSGGKSIGAGARNYWTKSDGSMCGRTVCTVGFGRNTRSCVRWW